MSDAADYIERCAKDLEDRAHAMRLNAQLVRATERLHAAQRAAGEEPARPEVRTQVREDELRVDGGGPGRGADREQVVVDAVADLPTAGAVGVLDRDTAEDEAARLTHKRIQALTLVHLQVGPRYLVEHLGQVVDAIWKRVHA